MNEPDDRPLRADVVADATAHPHRAAGLADDERARPRPRGSLIEVLETIAGQVDDRNIDDILGDVGQDPEAAAAALDAEQARTAGPRKTLVAKLETIAGGETADQTTEETS